MCTAVSISFSVESLVSVSGSSIATCNSGGEVLTVVPGEAGIMARAVGCIALEGCGEQVVSNCCRMLRGRGLLQSLTFARIVSKLPQFCCHCFYAVLLCTLRLRGVAMVSLPAIRLGAFLLIFGHGCGFY